MPHATKLNRDHDTNPIRRYSQRNDSSIYVIHVTASILVMFVEPYHPSPIIPSKPRRTGQCFRTKMLEHTVSRHEVAD